MLNKKQVSKKVGQQIKLTRVKAGMSQEELADKAGFYRTYAGHVEVGRYTPTIFTLYKIAKTLKVKVSALIPF